MGWRWNWRWSLGSSGRTKLGWRGSTGHGGGASCSRGAAINFHSVVAIGVGLGLGIHNHSTFGQLGCILTPPMLPFKHIRWESNPLAAIPAPVHSILVLPLAATFLMQGVVARVTAKLPLLDEGPLQTLNAGLHVQGSSLPQYLWSQLADGKFPTGMDPVVVLVEELGKRKVFF